VRGEVYMSRDDFERYNERQRASAATWSIRATAPPAASASSTRPWPPSGRCPSMPTAWARRGLGPAGDACGVLDALAAFGLPVCEHRAVVQGADG
jgi:DNA ligase (NAD+)